MSKVIDVEGKVKAELLKIDIKDLREKAILAGYLHDRVVPMINEVVMSASNAKNYEDAYKSVIDNLRLVHENIAAEKKNADTLLLTSVGKQQALTEVLQDLEAIANEEREKIKKSRVDDIATRIQSGTFNPDSIRKVGERPESLKNIRAAKQTLFGNNSNESVPEED